MLGVQGSGKDGSRMSAKQRGSRIQKQFNHSEVY
jgi:hypothetical protein